MIEDVRVGVQVVEALRGQHHCHVIAAVEERHRAEEEVLLGDLVRVKDCNNLVPWDRNALCTALQLENQSRRPVQHMLLTSPCPLDLRDMYPIACCDGNAPSYRACQKDNHLFNF